MKDKFPGILLNNVLRERCRMAKWVCSKCGRKVEGRCRPKQCPACGAPKEDFSKEG